MIVGFHTTSNALWMSRKMVPTGDEFKLYLNSIIDVSTSPADLVDFYLPQSALVCVKPTKKLKS